MKIILTCKSKKGIEASEKEIDQATDLVEKLMFYIDDNFKGFKWTGVKCMCDGTQVVLEK